MGWGFLPYLDKKLTLPAVVHEFYRLSAVKIPTPNIPRFAKSIPNTPGMKQITSFSCIKYRMILKAKRVLGLRRCFSYEPYTENELGSSALCSLATVASRAHSVRASNCHTLAGRRHHFGDHAPIASARKSAKLKEADRRLHSVWQISWHWLSVRRTWT